jgi:hypothetical protein
MKNRLIFMNPTERATEVQSPAQRAGIIAALACLACVIYLFAVGAPAMEVLQMRWAGLLVCTLFPMTLTFTILYGSCIHREMSRAARTLFLLLVSLLIFGGACLSVGIIAFITFAVLPLSRFHY